MFTKRSLLMASCAAGVMASSAMAGIPKFNTALSSATITHDLDINNTASAAVTSQPLVIQGATPAINFTNTLTFGTGSSKANFGIGHYESVTGAKIVFASGSGADQVDPDHLLPASRVKLDFTFVWDIVGTKYGAPITTPFSMPIGGRVLDPGSAQATANIQWQSVINGGAPTNMRTAFNGTTGPLGGVFLTSLSAPSASTSPISMPFTPGANRIILTGSTWFDVNNDLEPTFMRIEYAPDVLQTEGINTDIGGFDIQRPLIISDSFTAPQGNTVWYQPPAQAQDVNLPSAVHIPKGPDNDNGYTRDGFVELDGNMGLAMRITDFGGYVKPTALTIGADMVIEPGFPAPQNNTQGLALGYYTANDPDETETLASEGFTGLVLNPVDGALTLVVNGADSGQTIPYPATFDPSVMHYLMYDIDTVSGGIGNIFLDDFVITGFVTTAFNVPGATDYAGFYAISPNPHYGRFDHFTVAETIDFGAIPEPASAGLLVLGAAAMFRRRGATKARA